MLRVFKKVLTYIAYLQNKKNNHELNRWLTEVISDYIKAQIFISMAF